MGVEVLPSEGKRRGGARGEAVEGLPQGVPLAGERGDGGLQLRHRQHRWWRMVRARSRHRRGRVLGFWGGGAGALRGGAGAHRVLRRRGTVEQGPLPRWFSFFLDIAEVVLFLF